MSNSLTPGKRLRPGAQLKSLNGVHALTMYDHGLLILSGGPTTVVVPCNGAVPGSYAELREGGNFVICVPDGSRTTWESGPRGPGDLILHDTGRITIGASILATGIIPIPGPVVTPGGNTLELGGRLGPRGQLRSLNGVHALNMFEDGVLALSSGQTTVVEIRGVPGSYAELREGGNFVLSDGSNTFWASGPRGPGPLVLHDTGRITIAGNILV
jgi:hypothetical protein